MLSFKNDIELKNSLVKKVKERQETDRIIKNRYREVGERYSEGCMCEVTDDAYRILEQKYSIPKWLGTMIDRIFEGMTDENAIKFHLEIVQAIPVGIDLNQVKAPILIFILESALQRFDHYKYPDCKESIDNVINLYKSGKTDVEKFKTASRFAHAAYNDTFDKADSARNAGNTAHAATHAAAAHAAAAASHSASGYYSSCTSSYSAANSAQAAFDYYTAYAHAQGYSCSYSYVDIVSGGAKDAKSNEYKKFGDKLLEILKDCK